VPFRSDSISASSVQEEFQAIRIAPRVYTTLGELETKPLPPSNSRELKTQSRGR
jgi:hypothetical protein